MSFYTFARGLVKIYYKFAFRMDIQGEEKKKLTVRNLLDQFEKASGQEFSNDSALLS